MNKRTQSFLTLSKSTSCMSSTFRTNITVHSPKSNCSNTLQLYSSKDQDYVSKLHFCSDNQSNFASTSSSFNPFSQVTTAISAKYMSMLEIISDQNMKKKQNVINEKFFENKLSMLSKQIATNEKKLRDTYDKCKDKLKQIESIKLELEVINNFEHYSQLGDKLPKISTQSDFCQKMSYRDYIKTHLNKIGKIGREKEVQLTKIKNEHKECIKDIRAIEEEMREIKCIYKNAKDNLIDHYHKVLEEGRDTRKEGLSWIIQKIWRLRGEVVMSYLPTFLDEKAIDFLFVLSTLEWSKEQMKEELAQINTILSQSSSILNIQTNEDSKNQTQILRKKINQLQLTKGKGRVVVPVVQKDKTSFKNMIECFDTPKKITQECNVLLTILQEKEKAIEKLDREIKDLKKRELKRVCMEFYKYDYERRYKAPLNMVLSALIGEGYSALDVSRQSKDMQTFIKSIHQLKKSNNPDSRDSEQ